MDPNPGISRGETIATATVAAATLRAPLPAVDVSRAARPGEAHTGPQPWTRRRLSANTTAVAATRNATPYTGRTTSSSTVSAKATRATGGNRASSGLPARNASAWAEKMAAHVPVRAARSRGGSGAVGATWILACSPISPAARTAAEIVSRVGSPNQVVSGKTKIPIAISMPNALTAVASSRFRRSIAQASSAEASATTTIS